MADQNQTAELTVLLNGEQAAKELDSLKTHARDLSKEIDAARQAGNNAFAQQLTKELKNTNQEMKRLKQETFDTSKVLSNLSTAKPKELRETLSALNAQLNSKNIVRGSEEWNKLNESIRKVKNELSAVAAESNAAGQKVSSFSSNVKSAIAPVTAFVASLTALAWAGRKWSDESAMMDDVYSDVMKTTGKTKEEVLALNEAFKTFDTRTLRDSLNAIAEEGGRIGIAADDILEFTEAMNIANVALGDTFTGGVEEVANVLGKLKFLFQETKDMNVGDAYLAIGSALNELGANGMASEANIANFATRVGSLPSALKPSISSTLALGAAFEESGIEAEVSARAYNIFLKQASTDADKFAKVMNITRQEVESLINTDPLEFFLRFSEGLKGMDATDISKTLSFLGVNADGANKALGAAANNTERFRELLVLSNISFKEGTSVLNEYNIKNNNTAADLEKSRGALKDVHEELGRSFTPLVIKATEANTSFLRTLVDLIKWGKENKVLLTALLSVWGAYIVSLNRARISTSLLALSNGQLMTSLKDMFKLLKANPWGLIATGAVLGITWLNKYLNKQKEVNAEQSKFIKLSEKTKELYADSGALEQRTKVMKNLSKAQLETLQSDLDLQIKALEDHDAAIKTETKKVLDNDKELSDLKAKRLNAQNDIEKLSISTQIRWRENALTESLRKDYALNKQAIANLTNHKNEVDKLLKNTPDNKPYTIVDPDSDKKTTAQRKRINDELKKVEEKHLQEMSSIKKRYVDQDIDTEEEYLLELEKQNQSYDDKRKEALLNLLKSVTDPSLRLDLLKQVAEIEEKGLDRLIALRTKLNKQAETDKKTAVTSEMKRLDAEMAEREALLAKEHRDGLISEGAYKESLLALELEFLKKKKGINNITDDQVAGLDKDISLNTADTADFKTNERKSARERFDLIPPEEVRAEALKQLEDFEARGVLTHDEAMEAKRLIDEEYLEALTGKLSEANEKIQNVTGNLSSAITGFAQAEEMSVTRKYDKMIAAAEGNTARQKKLEEKKEKELAAIRARYADKEFVVKAASIGASTAVAAMQAYAAMAGIPVVGPALGAIAAAAAVAAGAAQIAVANQERENAKSGYAGGGYTPSGPWDKPQGVVHSDEFIGNRLAVRNPTVRKIFDVVDQAQKNNTVSSLSERDFAKALDYREAENRATVSGITAALSSGYGTDEESAINAELLAWVRTTNETNEKLSKRLDDPLVAEVAITGKNGFEEAWNKYQRIKKDAQR